MKSTRWLSVLVALTCGVSGSDVMAQPGGDSIVTEVVEAQEESGDAEVASEAEVVEADEVKEGTSKDVVAESPELGEAARDSETATEPEQTTEVAPEEAELSEAELRALEASLAEDEVAQENTAEASPGPMIAGIQSMNPDISVILDVAAAYFTDEEPLQTGGHDPTRSGFNFQQLEMHIGSTVDPYLAFDANLVFSQFGVEVEEAYFTTLALPGSLQVRGGQLYTRFGRINPTHPHQWAFLDQPIVNGKFFGSEGSRGLGAELSWLAPLPWFVELVASSTDAAGECCARSFFGADDLGVNGPEDLLYTFALKHFFELTPDVGLKWGLSSQFGPNPSGLGNRTEIYGTDLYLRWRPVDSQSRMALSLQLEAMLRTRQVPHDVLQDAGGYGQVVWTINPEWETGARYEFVSGVENDPIEDEWLDDRQRASLQLTYYPSHFSRFRLQGNWDKPEFREDTIWAVMLGVELLVGAHGAHAY